VKNTWVNWTKAWQIFPPPFPASGRGGVKIEQLATGHIHLQKSILGVRNWVSFCTTVFFIKMYNQHLLLSSASTYEDLQEEK